MYISSRKLVKEKWDYAVKGICSLEPTTLMPCPPLFPWRSKYGFPPVTKFSRNVLGGKRELAVRVLSLLRNPFHFKTGPKLFYTPLQFLLTPDSLWKPLWSVELADWDNLFLKPFPFLLLQVYAPPTLDIYESFL